MSNLSFTLYGKRSSMNDKYGEMLAIIIAHHVASFYSPHLAACYIDRDTLLFN